MRCTWAAGRASTPRCLAPPASRPSSATCTGTCRRDEPSTLTRRRRPRSPHSDYVQPLVSRENGVDPRSVGYVEADGFGNHCFDAVELNALDAVLGKKRPAGQPLLVGSIKSNAGHTEVCSGMFGMVKAIVAMEGGVIPATINHTKDLVSARGFAEGRLKVMFGFAFHRKSREKVTTRTFATINRLTSRAQVVTENTPLEIRPDTCVAVNTLSLAGQCGHAILRPNLKVKKPVTDVSRELPRLVLLSGRSEEAVTKVAEKVGCPMLRPTGGDVHVSGMLTSGSPGSPGSRGAVRPGVHPLAAGHLRPVHPWVRVPQLRHLPLASEPSRQSRGEYADRYSSGTPGLPRG